MNSDGAMPVCLVCEHAGSDIPEGLRELGLDPENRFSHAVHDIGARRLSVEMAKILNAPLVLTSWSRLVYDLNRPPDAPGAMPDRVEVIDVPGNRGLTSGDRQARAEEFYFPFHARVAEVIEGLGERPTLVTVHSFTPFWHGITRDAEIGFLHDADPSLAEAMLAAYRGPHRAELNVPYSAADGVTHTLARHGTSRGIPNVMIEVRNDLLSEAGLIDDIAKQLSTTIITALERVS